ncbi:MAG: RidA family protein [FCB group bacterium]|jgi:2-iminobutanoate/2-iminopropanoate deaminase|nr:RidA family protein [FCB group bacterium]
MQKRCVPAQKGPAATGPYSQAVVAGNMVFISGQICLAPDGSGPIRGTFEDEARQTLENVKLTLEDAGTDLAHIVKVTVFLADMNNFPKLNELYKQYFTSDFPCRTTVQVARLPLDVQVEIEAIALLPE